MGAAAVRQGAVLRLLPAEAAVQLRAEAAELPRRAEAAELPRRAEAAELASCAEAAYQRRRYSRWPATVRQEACDCREASRCWLRGRLLRP